MSLKAKLEAVIYAAEEPVTLAQLSALFATDALEWKAAREAASLEAAGVENEEAEPAPLLNAELEFAEMERPSEPAGSSEAEPAGEAGSEADPVEAVAEVTSKATPETPADLEAEAKRIARAKDREVRQVLRALLDELIADYASDDRGIEIKEIAGGFRMATKPECHDAARMFVKSLKPAMKLSLPALETLAVIAYKQPITAPEVNEIRGVDSSGVFGSLLARKLISTAGRKQVIGRPILYKTTKEFLLKFGLNEVTELPSMEEFEKMAQLEFEGMESAEENATEETAADQAFADTEGPEDPGVPDVDDDPDETDNTPVEEPGENPAPQQEPEQPAEPPVGEPPAEADEPAQAVEESHQQPEATAETADSNETPQADQPEATEAALTPAEAAPAAPLSQEQAETETVPHD